MKYETLHFVQGDNFETFARASRGKKFISLTNCTKRRIFVLLRETIIAGHKRKF
jgi:hypothetical protein